MRCNSVPECFRLRGDLGGGLHVSHNLAYGSYLRESGFHRGTLSADMLGHCGFGWECASVGITVPHLVVGKGEVQIWLGEKIAGATR